MSEMVERVARIIDPGASWDASSEREAAHRALDRSLHAETPFHWITRCDAALAKARAVIVAMREPTGAMKALDASLGPRWDNPAESRYALLGHTGAGWQQMIDEALK